MKLEKENRNEDVKSSIIQGMPLGVFEEFIVHGLSVDLIQPRRVICSLNVPSRLLNSGNSLDGAAIASLAGAVATAAMYTVAAEKTCVSLEFNISYLAAAYLHEEIEIEANVLRVGKAVGVVSVQLKNKKTAKIIANGRLTKYLVPPSKM